MLPARDSLGVHGRKNDAGRRSQPHIFEYVLALDLLMCDIIPMGFKSSRATKSRAAKNKAASKPAKRSAAKKSKPAAKATSSSKIEPLRDTIRRAIVNALEGSHSLREAARALEMPYSSLRDKLYQLGIDVPERSNSRQRAEQALTVGKAKAKPKAKAKAKTKTKAKTKAKAKTKTRAKAKTKAKAKPKTKAKAKTRAKAKPKTKAKAKTRAKAKTKAKAPARKTRSRRK